MSDPFRMPTNEETQDAQKILKLEFHDDYIQFLQTGSDVANACFEAAIILPGASYLDIFEIADIAWNQMGLPRDLLPIVEDNTDYYCLNKNGEIIFWSHNGSTNEKWSGIKKYASS